MNRHPCLRKLTLLGGLLFMASAGSFSGNAGNLGAQEPSPPGAIMPGLRERAVVLDIVARIVEQDQEEIWNSNNSKVTIMGRPVSIKMIGENVVVYVQFTPYRQESGRSLLVAQGQIWINVPNEGVRYQSTLQSIPMEFGEQVYYFPLGKVRSGNEASIEIQLELHPYLNDAEPGLPPEIAPEDAETE
ncbi:MAG: hypothetical protein LBK63_01025 [Treponema sp.]|jgi:hypothetical protein|nr:hypothetical protein [Treponema sp.]